MRYVTPASHLVLSRWAIHRASIIGKIGHRRSLGRWNTSLVDALLVVNVKKEQLSLTSLPRVESVPSRSPTCVSLESSCVHCTRINSHISFTECLVSSSCTEILSDVHSFLFLSLCVKQSNDELHHKLLGSWTETVQRVRAILQRVCARQADWGVRRHTGVLRRRTKISSRAKE
jgi:hypothetical protein